MDQFTNAAGPREVSESVYEVAFTPALEREEYQTEPLHSKLRITYNGKQLWLITKSERKRTLIEGKYLPMIAEIFGVVAPRVFSQP